MPCPSGRAMMFGFGGPATSATAIRTSRVLCPVPACHALRSNSPSRAIRRHPPRPPRPRRRTGLRVRGARARATRVAPRRRRPRRRRSRHRARTFRARRATRWKSRRRASVAAPAPATPSLPKRARRAQRLDRIASRRTPDRQGRLHPGLRNLARPALRRLDLRTRARPTADRPDRLRLPRARRAPIPRPASLNFPACRS